MTTGLSQITEHQGSRGWTLAWLVRLLLRMPLLLLHLFIGLPLTLIWLNRLGESLSWGEKTFRAHAVNLWSAGLLRLFGITLKQIGQPVKAPALIVANHMAWMDIQVIHASENAGFVAKAEISRWPLIGWLARRGETLFHQRGSGDSSTGVAATITQRLREGKSVAIFPEGRVHAGDAVYRFHARLFKSAIAAGVPVQPAAIRYVLNGQRSNHIAFRSGENFLSAFFRLLGGPRSVAELHWLDCLGVSGLGRSELAAAAERSVRRAYESDTPCQ